MRTFGHRREFDTRMVVLLLCNAFVAFVACGGDGSTGKGASSANESGGSKAAGGQSPGGASASAPTCTTSADCPKSHAICEVCSDGTNACPWAKCVNGSCVSGTDSCPSVGDGGAKGVTCLVDLDCPKSHAICEVCPNGTNACPWAKCVKGTCVSGTDRCGSGHDASPE